MNVVTKEIHKLTLTYTMKGKNVIEVKDNVGNKMTFTADVDDTKSTALALKIVEEIIAHKIDELFNELARLSNDTQDLTLS